MRTSTCHFSHDAYGMVAEDYVQFETASAYMYETGAIQTLRGYEARRRKGELLTVTNRRWIKNALV